jgi:uracil-DNA glycosylase
MQQTLFDINKEVFLTEEWDKLLSAKYDVVLSLLNRVDIMRSKGRIIYPDTDEIFKVFRNLAPSKIKVVILGQDPYHDGNANGYAFGCKVETSPSLNQILYGIRYCYPEGQPLVKANTGLYIRPDKSLQYLVDQGVFLLNTILTVEAGSPLSHDVLGWQEFTDYVIEQLCRNYPDIIYLLLGKRANEMWSVIRGVSKKIRIISDIHPAALSYNQDFWRTDVFRQINDELKLLLKDEIFWL